MSPVRIGPATIADSRGTYEPGTVIETPTADLLALAEAKTKDPESGKPYATVIRPGAAPEPAPDTSPISGPTSPTSDPAAAEPTTPEKP